VYIQRPSAYEIGGCDCGNADPDWSEFKGHLWCATCQKDFIPKHGGVFDGPIPINVAHMLGLCFSRLHLKCQLIEQDECCAEQTRKRAALTARTERQPSGGPSQKEIVKPRSKS
jgi:hypothetical protein